MQSIWRHPPTPVALKVITRNKATEGPKFNHQLKTEITAMQMVKHPNVVRCYEVIATKSKVYIVSELVTGGDMFDRIVRAGRLSEKEALWYFRQLVAAVDHCHKHGIWHRDLKPENMLIDHYDNVKITDFGLSSLSDSDQKLDTVCGSPSYVAPEVLRGRGYDGRMADIWSMGCILYSMLTGRLPFDDQVGAVELYKRMYNNDFCFPESTPADAQKFIRRILTFHPHDRLSLSQMKRHPYFNKYHPEELTPRPAPKSNSFSWLSSKQPPDALASKVGTSNPKQPSGPAQINIFELIQVGLGHTLTACFEKGRRKLPPGVKRFTSDAAPMRILKAVAAGLARMEVETHDIVTSTFRIKGCVVSGRVKKNETKFVFRIYQLLPPASTPGRENGLYMGELRKIKGNTVDFGRLGAGLFRDTEVVRCISQPHVAPRGESWL